MVPVPYKYNFMPMQKLLAALLVSSLLSTAFTEEKKKRKPRPAPVVSPIIHDDGSVTFRLKAPNADEVAVTGEMVKGAVPLEKDEEGIWTATIEPVDPGLYGYSLSVDGLRMLDPGNPELKPGRSPKTSILHIPGNQPFDFRDVPHGTVHHHAYHSTPIDRFREMLVYTPPGYETGKDDYPLLVLQHGHSDKFSSWVGYGKAHWILDNLIADGRAKPMIVAMLDGHPIPESFGNGRSTENTEELRKDLVEFVLPMIEETYRVKEGRENRAIVGLSMGGLHALTIGFSELDTFSVVGSFSGAIPAHEVLEAAISDPEATNEKIELLWIACGKDDFLLDENKALIELLEQGRIEHEWLLTEGAHSWPVWRDYLTQFVPRLFP